MNMVQCMICLAEKGDDLLLISLSEFELHCIREHRSIDFNNLRYVAND